MHLPDPPMLSHFLLVNPWPLSLSLAAAAIVLAWIARQRGAGKLATAALVLILAALAVQVAATMVQTGREEVITETQSFLDTTAPLNVDAFAARLDSRITVNVPSGPWLTGDAAIVARLRREAGKFVIQRQVILHIEAEMRGDNAARTLFDVRTETSAGSFPSRWMITWVRFTGDPWQILSIEWLESDRLGAINPDMLNMR